MEVEAGRITRMGRDRPDRPAAEVELSGCVLLPALVNAHTHLELSGLRGAVSPASTVPAWAERAMAAMARTPPVSAAVHAALDESRAAGTGLVGDISNTLASVSPLAERGEAAVVFRELLGFDEHDPLDRVRAEVDRFLTEVGGAGGARAVRPGLAAHAPYSVSAELFRAIRAVAAEVGVDRFSVHGAESPEEVELLRHGTGAWRGVLMARGRWSAGWRPFDGTVGAYLDCLGWVTSGTLIAHGVHLTDDDLGRMARAGATVVTCPRSNAWTGAGPPPLARFYASGVRVAVGTDSLASAPDLNVFAELAEMRSIAPTVPASVIVRSGTRDGAVALGRLDRGAIAPGMRDAVIAIRCPTGVTDVEEYLLEGITPDLISWPAPS